MYKLLKCVIIHINTSRLLGNFFGYVYKVKYKVYHLKTVQNLNNDTHKTIL